jgi:hypothetical protein
VFVAPTQEELLRVAELRARSTVLDREIQQKADQLDADARKASPSK